MSHQLAVERCSISSAKVIAAGQTHTSGNINITKGRAFSLIVSALSGTTPNLSFTYQIAAEFDYAKADSAQSFPFITPSNNVIATGVSATTALGHVPVMAKFIRITITNNGANAATVTSDYMVQKEG